MKDMQKDGLYEKLINYAENGAYPLHMPGHKRNFNLLNGLDPCSVDITEIAGFDNLHCSSGIIRESMDNASNYWRTDATWFLVNGSSCGIMAALHAVANPGDHVIIGKNCHISVYNAVKLRLLNASEIAPAMIQPYGICGGYDDALLDDMLEKDKKVKAVVLTSPTYEGVVSNIEALADTAHRHGAVLIVDEAHGAHFGVSENLPRPAYELGADLVVESLHKTLPALTQSAQIHLKGERVKRERIEEALNIYQTTSPSYLLMAGMDYCIRYLQENGQKQMDDFLETVRNFRKNAGRLSWMSLIGKEQEGKNFVWKMDPTRIFIKVNSQICDGVALSKILREQYGYEVEMASAGYILAIFTICDDKKEIERFLDALRDIDRKVEAGEIAPDTSGVEYKKSAAAYEEISGEIAPGMAKNY